MTSGAESTEDPPKKHITQTRALEQGQRTEFMRFLRTPTAEC